MKRYENTTVVRHFWFIPIKLVAKLITLCRISYQLFVLKELYPRSWFVWFFACPPQLRWGKYQSDSLNLDFYYFLVMSIWFHYYLLRDHQLMSCALSDLYYQSFYELFGQLKSSTHLSIFVIYIIYVSLEKKHLITSSPIIFCTLWSLPVTPCSLCITDVWGICSSLKIWLVLQLAMAFSSLESWARCRRSFQNIESCLWNDWWTCKFKQIV